MQYLTHLLLIILVGSLPPILMLYYFIKKDEGEKEPNALMKTVFWGGIKVILPILVVELVLLNFAEAYGLTSSVIFILLSQFLLIALPEEFGKRWVVLEKAYTHPKFNEIMDGIQYCIIASMGFALVENLFYTLAYGPEVGVIRAFTAVPAHAFFSGIMGYYIGLAKFTTSPEKSQKLLKKGLFIAILFHGLYNTLLSSGETFLIILIFPFLIYMGLTLKQAIRKANAHSQLRPGMSKAKRKTLSIEQGQELEELRFI
jgi:RsiW-degrading membrane proteinase PrsW (M82 family)